MKPWKDIIKSGTGVVRFLGYVPDHNGDGAFIVRHNGRDLRVIASTGGGWDHVSVSLPDRCPVWNEMSHVKRAFFRADQWAYELHPPRGQNINCHPFCLHLWRPQNVDIPLPPRWMIAPETH